MTVRLDVKVTTADGECPCVLAIPDRDGRWPGIIFFMDAGGVRPAMVEMAEHLAGMGYVVLLPEMYYRSGTYEPFNLDTVFSHGAERQRLLAMVASVTKAGAASDTGSFLEFLVSRSEVAGTKVGTTGYCMGGSLSLSAAAHFPNQVVAAASVHGGHLATEAPDSVHRIVGRITGRVYVAAARDDDSFPPEQADLLKEALTSGAVEHTIETYPGLHGFAVPDNPTYDPALAERHWRALHDLFMATLPD